MGRYINWSDIIERYPSIENVGGAVEVGSVYISYVEYEIDGLLAPKFTIPFSNNNETVKDLCIDRVYAKAGNLKIEEYEKINNDVMATIDRLKTGSQLMIINGTSYSSVLPDIGDTIFSTTEDYNPVFGMSDIELSEVDSGQVYDEEQARGYY